MAELRTFFWWQWLPFQPWRIVATVSAADEIPAQVPRNGFVLVGTKQNPKWLVFDCPCRTGHRIMISLDRNHRPHWSIHTGKKNKLTVSPSVDSRTASRRCHYFIRNGRTDWVHDRSYQ